MKRLGIVCAPCSGTHFTCAALNECGLEVGYERGPQRDGECSWKAVLRPVGTFDVVLHQVRTPLPALSGLQALDQDFWDEVENYVNLPPQRCVVERCCEFWMQWNLFCEARACRTYRIRDVDSEFPEILKVMGRPPQPPPDIPRHHNTKRHLYEPFTVDQIRQSLPLDRWETLVAQCRRYGYEGVEG